MIYEIGIFQQTNKKFLNYFQYGEIWSLKAPRARGTRDGFIASKWGLVRVGGGREIQVSEVVFVRSREGIAGRGTLPENKRGRGVPT